MTILLRPILVLGLWTAGFLRFIGELTEIAGDAVVGLGRSLFTRQGRRLGWANLWEQTNRVGVRSIPIVALVLFCIGAILSLQLAPILKNYGASDKVANIISVAIGRELGPLVAAIVLTGFAGASIAAELGTMVVSEEIEALRAHAIDPNRFLIAPRVAATTVMLVCLCVVADYAGGIGGMLTAHLCLGTGANQYARHSLDALKMKDFVTGLVKAGVFGLIISVLACRLGMGVTGGAQGVGNATTRTVVLTIVALIFVDLLFTAVFYFAGW